MNPILLFFAAQTILLVAIAYGIYTLPAVNDAQMVDIIKMYCAT